MLLPYPLQSPPLIEQCSVLRHIHDGTKMLSMHRPTVKPGHKDSHCLGSKETKAACGLQDIGSLRTNTVYILAGAANNTYHLTSPSRGQHERFASPAWQHAGPYPASCNLIFHKSSLPATDLPLTNIFPLVGKNGVQAHYSCL